MPSCISSSDTISGEDCFADFAVDLYQQVDLAKFKSLQTWRLDKPYSLTSCSSKALLAVGLEYSSSIKLLSEPLYLLKY